MFRYKASSFPSQTFIVIMPLNCVQKELWRIERKNMFSECVKYESFMLKSHTHVMDACDMCNSINHLVVCTKLPRNV